MTRITGDLLAWQRRWWGRTVTGYALAVVLVAAVTVVLGQRLAGLTATHPSPLYLVAVLFCGALAGRGPAVLASVLSFLAFDWFFIPPTHTFTVANPEEWQSLVIALLTALVTGHLTALLHDRAEAANRREREAVALYEVGKALAGVPTPPAGPAQPAAPEASPPFAGGEREPQPGQVIGAKAMGAMGEATMIAALERLGEVLGLGRCDVLLLEVGGLRSVQGHTLDPATLAAARWVVEHGREASRGWARAGRLVRVRPPRPPTSPGPPTPPRSPSPPASPTPPVVFGSPSPATACRSAIPPPLPPTERLDAPDGAVFLPLLVHGRPLGVLHATSDRQVPMTKAERRVLAAAGDQLALAIERRRLQGEMVQTEVLRQTDTLRRALLSSVSHDLRTPLAAIKAAAGNLGMREVVWDEETRLAFARQIERESDRLNRLVSNLLDLSRIEAGALQVDRQWYPLRELMDDTLGRLTETLTRHRVVVEVPESLPPVPLDYVLIQQVLINLLENAAKYSPAGGQITVAARLDGDLVQVEVRDEGPGLAPEQRQRVFQPFYRVTGLAGPHQSADGTTAPRAGDRSTGLGLAVCAGFVAAHGGRIWVEAPSRGQESALDRTPAASGAIFCFALPVTPPGAGGPPRGARENEGESRQMEAEPGDAPDQPAPITKPGSPVHRPRRGIRPSAA